MRKIIIAPNNMHQKLLLKYRNGDPFVDVKVLSKEALISDYKGKISREAIPFIMKKFNYSYDNVLALLPFLPYVDETINEVYKIKQEVINSGLISKNEYLKTFFKNNEVDIYGYSERDTLLVNSLKELHVNYRFIKNGTVKEGQPLYEYENEFDETFFTLNNIAELLAKGVDINKIYLYYVDDGYTTYIKRFAPSFGFKVDIDESYSLYSVNPTNRFLKKYIETKDFALAKEYISDTKDTDLLNEIYNVINSCYDEEMSFETQLDYLIGELKHQKYSQKKYRDVVRVIDRPIFEEGAYIFMMGFAQGSYPRSQKDNKFISDKNRDRFQMNTSLNESECDEDTLIDFLGSNNHFVFSFASRSLSRKFFVSSLKERFNFESQTRKLPEIIYSRVLADYYFAKLLDLKEFYSETSSDYYALEKISDVPYGTYDNSFTGVRHFNTVDKLDYSYSSVNTFYECPFQYYLSKVLNLDPFEGNLYTKIGLIAHKIFELQYREDFDFDTVFDEEVTNAQFTNEELPLVNNLKNQIRKASQACLLHLRYMKNPRIYTETKVTFEFDKNSYLKGVIDKTVVLDNKYLAIVDYKTGNDSFSASDVKFGLSMQLPTYCLLTKNNKEFEHYELIGVFINNVVDGKLTFEESEETLINPFYRLNGKVLADLDAISYLDNTISGGKSLFIKGVGLKSNGIEFSKSSNLVSQEELEGYAIEALTKYKEANIRIRNNDFIINPQYKSKSDNACKYCPYKDICNVTAKQRRYLTENNAEEEEDETDE